VSTLLRRTGMSSARREAPVKVVDWRRKRSGRRWSGLGSCDARKKVADNGVAQHFDRGGHEVSGRRSYGTGADELR
jgi:hypothetical protein